MQGGWFKAKGKGAGNGKNPDAPGEEPGMISTKRSTTGLPVCLPMKIKSP